MNRTAAEKKKKKKRSGEEDEETQTEQAKSERRSRLAGMLEGENMAAILTFYQSRPKLVFYPWKWYHERILPFFKYIQGSSIATPKSTFVRAPRCLCQSIVHTDQTGGYTGAAIEQPQEEEEEHYYYYEAQLSSSLSSSSSSFSFFA